MHGAVGALIATAAAAQLPPVQPAAAPPAAPAPLKNGVTGAAKMPKIAAPASPQLVAPAPGRLSAGGPLVAVSPLLNAPLGSARLPAGGQVTSAAPVTRSIRLGAPATPQPGAISQGAIRATSAAAPRVPTYASQALANLTTLVVPPTASGARSLARARAERIDSLIRAYPSRLDRDDLGNPVVGGRLLAINPDSGSLERARRSGFTVTERLTQPELGLTVVAFGVPRGLNVRDALRRLKSAAPTLDADFDHIFLPAGGELGPTKGKLSRSQGSGGRLIGMIDGGVAAHPAISGGIAGQRGFAGPARATSHGTAVASLLIGRDGKFKGAANGAALLVADVYGGQVASGSASAMAAALGWLAANRPQVINISLVGPANELIRRAVAQVRARGIPIVAAVGNDGPAAPPQYPASYPGVIAVTGVDARGTALFESGNSAHLDFAAPGADMAAARPGQGYVRVRGTSFAAPLAAGRLVTVGSLMRLSAEARPGKGRVGRGIVCLDCRVDPTLVAAR